MKPKDEAKDQAIKKATLELVFEKGMAGIKMSEVAKRASIGTGSLYTYYKDKEALIETLYQDIEKQSLAALFAHVSPALPYPVRVKKICFNYMDYLIQHQKEVIFKEQYHRSPFCYHHVDPLAMDEKMERMIALITEGKSQHYLKQIPDLEMMMALDGIIKNIIQHYQTIKQPITQEIKERIFSICWDCLKA